MDGFSLCLCHRRAIEEVAAGGITKSIHLVTISLKKSRAKFNQYGNRFGNKEF
jgi:hypothetical protein